MRLEVLVGSEEPILYPLNKPRTVLGSADSCDIVLSADGISRKHVMVIMEEDQYFIVDQGSTNGSYVNEERLVPGRKVEFTSFFPVRLGENVLLTLLSDEDDSRPLTTFPSKEITKPKIVLPAKELGRQESTNVINLRDLTNSKTKNLIKERDEKRKIVAKNKIGPAKKKEQKPFPILNVIGGMLVLWAAYYTFYLKEDEVEVPVAQVGEVVRVAEPTVPSQNSKAASTLMPETELPNLEDLKRLHMDIKCVTEVEKYGCSVFPGTQKNNFGVIQVGTLVHVLVDGEDYFTEARKFFRKDPKESDLYKVAIALYLQKYFPNELDMNLFKDHRISISLFKRSGSARVPVVVVGFYPKNLSEIKKVLTKERVSGVVHYGAEALNFTKNYYPLIIL